MSSCSGSSICSRFFAASHHCLAKQMRSFFSSIGPSRLAIMTNACHGCTVTGVHSAMGDASLIIRQSNDQTLPNQHSQQRDKPQESKVLLDPNQIAVLRISHRPLSASFFIASSIQLPMNNRGHLPWGCMSRPVIRSLHSLACAYIIQGLWSQECGCYQTMQTPMCR